MYLYILPDHAKTRIDVFLNPDLDPRGSGYNIIQSKLAIGSGQLLGMGVKQGNQTQLGYLYPKTTDFIFSVIGEEMGFVGSCLFLGLLFLIAIECIITGARALDMPGRIICFGMAAIMTFQTFINLGVVTEILPNTGITLPFVSYGLSSLVSMYAGIGLVLSVRMTKKIALEEAMNEHRFNRA